MSMMRLRSTNYSKPLINLGGTRGALARKAKTEQVDVAGLVGMLRNERKSMENQASGGLLAGLLDQDGDGDFDFQGIIHGVLRHLFGRK